MLDSIHDYNARLDPLKVLEALELRESMHNYVYWRGLCPYHGSKSKVPLTFVVRLQTRMFYCNGCKRWGSLIQLWADVKCLTISDTLREMRERFP